MVARYTAVVNAPNRMKSSAWGMSVVDDSGMICSSTACRHRKMLRSLSVNYLSLLLLANVLATGLADAGSAIDVLGEEFSVTRYPAQGDELIIFFSAGSSSEERVRRVSAAVADLGIEVWQVDLAESLFLPASTTTMRSLDGRYVAGLITAAHRQTNKNITVMTRGYGAIPVLRGARRWQSDQAAEQNIGRNYLSGAILLTPELYSAIPDLGLDPLYAPITSATNIPILLLQGGKHGNRWQMNTLLDHLQQGGAMVYASLLPGVTGLFYDEDSAAETLQALLELPARISHATRILSLTPTPLVPADLQTTNSGSSAPMDTSLKPFKGNSMPLPLDLFDVSGKRVIHNNYRGQITVVNFWASWCKPCVEEIPSLNRLREKMKDKPFQLISVDYAEDREHILQFLQDVDVNFPVLLDADGKVSAEWNVLVFPSTFVIGPDGRIAYGVKGGILWDEKEVVDRLNALLVEPKQR